MQIDSSLPVSIVPMQPPDLPRVVEIHLASFPGFFLTFLGRDFLHLLYSEILTNPDHVAFAAKNGAGIPIGFVAGVVHQSAFYSNLIRRRWLAFALAAVRAILKKPAIVGRLLRALSYPKSTQAYAAQAILMSIGVEPGAQSMRVGQQLVTAFLNEMWHRGVRDVSLTTDRDHNERVNRFYQNLGFRLARTYVTPEGRGINEYLVSFRPRV